jgi:RimJ/RimL family protein N-acetyltransferase
MFSPLVSSHWIPDDVTISDLGAGQLRVAVDHALPEHRSVSLLHLAAGPAILRLTPARARELRLAHGETVSTDHARARIADAGLSLTDPDHLFFLTLEERSTLATEASTTHTRQLTAHDAAVFAAFTANAPADELDEAFVELDHWLVFGTFAGDTLASAASMYPWAGTKLADLGVITLPEFRGHGAARATVRAISAAALRAGYEPQFRCQLHNSASIALARASGFTLLGDWEVVDGA